MSDTKTAERMGYVGTCPHGIVMMLVVDDPATMAACADEIADMLRQGFTFDRMEASKVREKALSFDRCETCVNA